jgi:hypothetical protein
MIEFLLFIILISLPPTRVLIYSILGVLLEYVWLGVFILVFFFMKKR